MCESRLKWLKGIAAVHNVSLDVLVAIYTIGYEEGKDDLY